MASVSVIVPVYRVEKYIHRCVDSILAQSFRDFELILVDDGSPDSCGAICDEYAVKDNRITVLHRENGGLSAARNTGIQWALENSDSGYLTFIDSDDWIHPQYLEVLLQGIAAGADASMVGRCYTATQSEFVLFAKLPQPVLLEPEALFLSREWDFNYAWGKLYRKAAFRTLRYPEGKNFEDVFTTYRAFFGCSRIALTDAALYYYFHNTEGISHSPWNPGELVIFEGMRAQMAFYKENGYDRAFAKEEKLYVNHYAYQLVRIRANRADWKKNRPHWKRLRREMLALLKEKRTLYNRATMPQCYEAAWPVWARMKLRLGNAAQVLRREGIRGIALRLRQMLGGK